MKPIVFTDEGWLGSCARSFREALARQDIPIENLSDDAFFPNWQPLYLRIPRRLIMPLLVREYEHALLSKIRASGAQVVIAYKGSVVSGHLVRQMREMGCKVVNVYPDNSPLAYGTSLAKALAEYDLVVSTKVWHPSNWESLFGYRNRCRFVAQGYDPYLHYRPFHAREGDQQVDVVLVATYRPEYGRLMVDLAKQKGLPDVRVTIYGYGWGKLRRELPPAWSIRPAVQGFAYGAALLSGKVCIAPLTRDVVVGGRRYPGDEDSTRTYELPALGTFFVHRRTRYVQEIFDESEEVPMFDDAGELAERIQQGLADDGRRQRMAAAAQRRSVPRDSLDSRAKEFLAILQEEKIL